MRVLVACEYSGVVRQAFAARGHQAWSCDLLPAEDSSPLHYQGDVRDLLTPEWPWDLMIAFPPCTHLAVSGARYFKDKVAQQAEALAFVRQLMQAPIPRIALENPIGVLSTRLRKPDQIIQPNQFGHDASKATCLWLKNLPLLRHGVLVPASHPGKYGRLVWGNQTPGGQNKLGPSPTRAMERSRTYPGIANAMAEQWGGPRACRSYQLQLF